METYVVWLQIFLKQQLKKPLYWVELLLLVAGIWSVAAIRLPDAENCRIGYCYDSTGSADWLAAELGSRDETLHFCFYEEKNRLYADVRSGCIDCGFVLPVQIDEGSSVESVVSPMSTKSALAELHVFDACYRVLSEDILLETDHRLYGQDDQERRELLLQMNRDLLESDRVFDIQMREVLVENPRVQKQFQVFPVQGIAGTIVITMMLLAGGVVFDPKNRGFLRALSLSRRRRVCVLYSLAAALLPAVVSVVWICMTGSSRGVCKELLSMLLLVAWSLLWIRFAVTGMRDAERFHVELMIFLVVQMLVCPVFADLSEYLPALRVIRLLFPLGIYLQ